MTVGITRHELGAGDLRREARRCRDGAASRRMLALALVLEGASREEAARAAGMDRQTLRDWVQVQRGGARWPARPTSIGTQAAAHARAGSGAGHRRRAGAGPRPRRRGALAAGGPPGPDRGPLPGPAARTPGPQD